MSRKDGGPAYPIYQPDMDVGDDAGPGMTLRDWFAGKVISGLMANPEHSPTTWNTQYHAEWSFKLADAMIAERDKETSE